ncbi:hypothetical protein ACRU3B_10565 [Mycobacterium colombiense]
MLLIFGAVRYWAWTAVVIGAGVALILLWKVVDRVDRWLERREDQRVAARERRAAIARRADEQHAQVLAGDERGVYGEYRPHEDFPPNAHMHGREEGRKGKDPRRPDWAGPRGMAEI